MGISGGRWTGPIWDTHMHLDFNARGVSAAQDFANAGGTHICLVHKPGFPDQLPKSIGDVKNAYEGTLKMANAVRREVGIEVYPILGPHPVVWEKQIHTIGMEVSNQLHIESVELAISYCQEGQAVAIGEVGRPHYSVSDEVWDAANIQLLEVMKMAKSADFPIQLHVEENAAQTNLELGEICDKAGLSREQAVHHYASGDVSNDFTHGLSSSVSMGKRSVENILHSYQQSDCKWTMETDYLDDLNRPGAVLGPKTVPKRTQTLTSSLLELEDPSEIENLLMNIHHFWPESLYAKFDP